MSNINIENLGYDMNMDREAMDSITGARGFSSFQRRAMKTYRNVRTGYTPIGRLVCKLRPQIAYPFPRHCRR